MKETNYTKNQEGQSKAPLILAILSVLSSLGAILGIQFWPIDALEDKNSDLENDIEEAEELNEKIDVAEEKALQAIQSPSGGNGFSDFPILDENGKPILSENGDPVVTKIIGYDENTNQYTFSTDDIKKDNLETIENNTNEIENNEDEITKWRYGQIGIGGAGVAGVTAAAGFRMAENRTKTHLERLKEQTQKSPAVSNAKS